MKKFVFIFIILFSLIAITGCETKTETAEKAEVTVNMPTDDTVNGYRLPEAQQSDTLPEIITEDKVVAGKLPQGNNGKTKFCASKNSKTFHKSDCSSVNSIKKENRIYEETRTAFIDKGYNPCKKCKP